MICDGCDAEQEPFQDPLSLSLGVFFTALKNSNIRNHVKSQFDNSEGSICQLHVMEAEKGFCKYSACLLLEKL